MVGIRLAHGSLSMALLFSAALCAAEARAAGAPAAQRETAVAPENNPPGDIPDDQAFVTYASPAGFSIEVPDALSYPAGQLSLFAVAAALRVARDRGTGGAEPSPSS